MNTVTVVSLNIRNPDALLTMAEVEMMGQYALQEPGVIEGEFHFEPGMESYWNSLHERICYMEEEKGRGERVDWIREGF